MKQGNNFNKVMESENHLKNRVCVKTKTMFLVVIMFFIAINMMSQTWKIGDNVTATLNGDVMTISGTGAISGYSTNYLYTIEAPYYNSRLSVKSLIIEEGVTTIGGSSFYSFSNLTSVIIPNTITSIGSYAFSDCSSLMEIAIPNSVTTISMYAFSSCVKLKNIVIENGESTLSFGTTSSSYSSDVFYNSPIETLYMGRNISYYSNPSPFGNKINLTSVTIGNSVTTISNSAFVNCKGLTSVTMPNTITSINSSAFSGCSSLKSVTIPKSVLSIGSSAFSGCSGLVSITFKTIVPPTVGQSAFLNVPSTAEVIIPCQTLSFYQNSNYQNLFTNFTEDEDCSWVQQKTIHYVKVGGTGDGSSWTNAAGNIQDMINLSVSGRGDQVWIAGGTYLLSATLQMKVGVNVYGGFFGDETDINNRSKSDKDGNGTIEPWEFTNSTILDGQNARQVLYQDNPFEIETTWDGVTITKGSSSSGAGAYIRAKGKLNNCIITQNTIPVNYYLGYGGGIYNDGGTINNCTVYRNTINAYYDGRVLWSAVAEGAGIYNKGTVSNCMIFNNYCYSKNNVSASATSYGGGIYNEGIVNTCCIYNNGVYAISSNTSSYYAGGIYNYGTGSNKAYVYCSTILNNGQNNIYNYYDKDGSHGFVCNCIIENSDIEQNFIRPTSFVGEAGNDDARSAELLRADWRLKQGSQYIESGSLADLPDWVINGTDLAGNPRVSNGKISVGAYEFDPTVNAIKLTHFDKGIKIYQNPVSNSFIVDYEGFIQVKIYDMLGKEILSQDTNGKTEININHLSKGIYNVSVISGGRIIGNSKIMKQ